MSEEAGVEVIVVGGGISGLTAAYTIKKRCPDLSVVVLEANERVGGRTHTVSMVSSSGTDKWDLGGQWVGQCQHYVMQLLQDLGLATYRQYKKGTKLQQIGEDKVRSYESDIPKLSVLSLIDLFMIIWKLNRYSRQLCLSDPFSHPKAKEWDSVSFEAFLDRIAYTNAAVSANKAAFRTLMGCELGQVSALYTLLFIRMSGSLEKLIEANEFTAQESRVKGGAQQISLELSKKIGEDNVHVNEAVTDIQQTDTGVNVTTQSGWKRQASYVILATPPNALRHIKFNPKLASDYEDMVKHMALGYLTKIIVTYDKAFWREKGMSGEFVSDGGESGWSVAPMAVGYDASSENGCPALVGFVGGQPAIELAKRSEKERQAAVLNHFATFFGKDVYNFLDYAEKDWNKEPYNWGSPVTYLSTGNVFNYCQAIRRVEGRLVGDVALKSISLLMILVNPFLPK